MRWSSISCLARVGFMRLLRARQALIRWPWPGGMWCGVPAGPFNGVKVVMEVVEKYLQIPLPEDYIERLNKRAAEYDRVMSREGARIIKDVLDGRYEPVRTFNQQKAKEVA